MNIYQIYFLPRFDDTMLHRNYVMMSSCNNITHVLAASLEKRWFTLVRGDVKCFETRHWFVEIRT